MSSSLSASDNHDSRAISLWRDRLQEYRAAQVERPNDMRVRYNLGTALYYCAAYSEAADVFQSIIEKRSTTVSLSWVLYNKGNALFALKDYQGAIAAYRACLVEDSTDEDARYNLEVALRLWLQTYHNDKKVSLTQKIKRVRSVLEKRKDALDYELEQLQEEMKHIESYVASNLSEENDIAFQQEISLVEAKIKAIENKIAENEALLTKLNGLRDSQDEPVLSATKSRDEEVSDMSNAENNIESLEKMYEMLVSEVTGAQNDKKKEAMEQGDISETTEKNDDKDPESTRSGEDEAEKTMPSEKGEESGPGEKPGSEKSEGSGQSGSMSQGEEQDSNSQQGSPEETTGSSAKDKATTGTQSAGDKNQESSGEPSGKPDSMSQGGEQDLNSQQGSPWSKEKIMEQSKDLSKGLERTANDVRGGEIPGDISMQHGDKRESLADEQYREQGISLDKREQSGETNSSGSRSEKNETVEKENTESEGTFYEGNINEEGSSELTQSGVPERSEATNRLNENEVQNLEKFQDAVSERKDAEGRTKSEQMKKVQNGLKEEIEIIEEAISNQRKVYNELLDEIKRISESVESLEIDSEGDAGDEMTLGNNEREKTDANAQIERLKSFALEEQEQQKLLSEDKTDSRKNDVPAGADNDRDLSDTSTNGTTVVEKQESHASRGGLDDAGIIGTVLKGSADQNLDSIKNAEGVLNAIAQQEKENMESIVRGGIGTGGGLRSEQKDASSVNNQSKDVKKDW